MNKNVIEIDIYPKLKHSLQKGKIKRNRGFTVFCCRDCGKSM